MKNKKLLLVATAAMGFVALGTAGVGTAAWYSANQSATAVLSNNTDATIRTNNTVTVSGINITIPVVWHFDSPDATVQLTAGAHRDSDATSVEQNIGTTYAVDQNSKVVEAANQGSLVKSRRGYITLDNTAANITKNGNGTATTAQDRDLLHNITLTMYIMADNQLRVSAASGTNAASDAAWTTNNYVGAYTASTHVAIGTIKITTSSGAVSFAYTAALDINGGSADAGLNFYYSASPKDDDGTSGESTDASYGTLTVGITSQS